MQKLGRSLNTFKQSFTKTFLPARLQQSRTMLPQAQPSKESFNITFKFRPYNLYRITSDDDKYVMCISNDTKDFTIYVRENDGKYDDKFTALNELTFIDADTGCISFFNSDYPYMTFELGMSAVEVTHHDFIGDSALFIFDDSGAIRCKDAGTYYLTCKFDKGEDGTTPILPGKLSVTPDTELEGVDVKYWKYTEMYDARDLLNEHITALETAAIVDTGEQTIDSLKQLNNNNIRLADIEIKYRDNIIKGYEDNVFIKNVINGGKTPSSTLISSRTFAKELPFPSIDTLEQQLEERTTPPSTTTPTTPSTTTSTTTPTTPPTTTSTTTNEATPEAYRMMPIKARFTMTSTAHESFHALPRLSSSRHRKH